MSGLSFTEVNALIKKYSKLADFVGPVSDDQITAAERELSVAFPVSYRLFLRKYGCGNFGAQEFFGLGIPPTGIPNVIWSTRRLRHTEMSFPDTFVVIYNAGEGEIFCLDTASMDNHSECRVVRWIPGLPVKLQDYEVIAPTFGELLLKHVREQVDRYKARTGEREFRI